MSTRITRKMVEYKLECLNSVIKRRGGVYQYRVFSEYGCLVLEKFNSDSTDSVLRGLKTSEMYNAIKCAWDILIDNIPVKEEL